MIKGLVSIIIPTYNRSFLLKRCLNNILQQSYLKIEIIVVDDGSEDETFNVVQRIIIDLNNRNEDVSVRYYYKKNEGAVKARNFGLNKSRGEFIVFQDSDDLMEKNRILLQIKKIINTNVDASVCSIIEYPSKKILFIPEDSYIDPITSFFSGELHGGTQAWMFSRKCIDNIHGYDESLTCHQDLDLTFRMLISGHSICSVPDAHSYFYNHDGDRVSKNAESIHGMYSVISYYEKRAQYIIEKKDKKLVLIELKNLFHLYIECLRINSNKQAVMVMKLMTKINTVNNLRTLVITSNLTAYVYLFASSIFRKINKWLNL